MSDIEGKAERVAASECGQRVSFNDEWSEWDERHRRVRAGLAFPARVAASECG
jgi:hypothetical protein